MQVKPLPEIKPVRPNPVKLYDEPWKVCGKLICLTPAEAQRSLENKIELIRFTRESSALLDYYERRYVMPEPQPEK